VASQSVLTNMYSNTNNAFETTAPKYIGKQLKDKTAAQRLLSIIF
jgi:hypothetical protein